MIVYKSRGGHQLLNIFRIRGSVFPFALLVSIPSAVLAGVLKWAILNGHWKSLNFNMDGDYSEGPKILAEPAVWSGFTFLVGFLIVFRTSISYERFSEGCKATHRFRAEWFDACSAICAFCRHSKVPAADVQEFQHTLVRCFSMLHVLALAEIEDSSTKDMGSAHALSLDVVDLFGLDEETLRSVRASSSRVELVFQWIQQLIVENIETGVLSIPPPILSRVFQELANGMAAFHDAVKLSSIPFPFPYAQACDTLLILHWCITPIITSQWVTSVGWSATFAFIQVFILWSLNCTATEIENPFGHDDNDLNEGQMQHEFNEHLLMLIKTSTLRCPRLSVHALCHYNMGSDWEDDIHGACTSFEEVWNCQGLKTATLAPLKVGLRNAKKVKASHHEAVRRRHGRLKSRFLGLLGVPNSGQGGGQGGGQGSESLGGQSRYESEGASEAASSAAPPQFGTSRAARRQNSSASLGSKVSKVSRADAQLEARIEAAARSAATRSHELRMQYDFRDQTWKPHDGQKAEPFGGAPHPASSGGSSSREVMSEPVPSRPGVSHGPLGTPEPAARPAPLQLDRAMRV